MTNIHIEKDLIYEHSLSYLVGLSLLTDYPDGISIESSKGQYRMALSATLFSYRGIVTLATAGHILEQIKAIVDNGYTVKLNLIDAWSKGAINNDPIPLPFDIEDCWFTNNDGIDIGFIPLRQNTVDLLIANNVRLINESHWAVKPNDDKFDICAALGLPVDQFTANASENEAALCISPTMVRLEHKFGIPNSVKNDAPAFWYGRVPENEIHKMPFKLNGLSGGPVFGFKRNNDQSIQLYVIGWQFGVKKCNEHRYFCVTPTYLIGRILETQFEELMKNSDDAIQ